MLTLGRAAAVGASLSPERVPAKVRNPPKQSLVAGNRDGEKCAEADLGYSLEARPSKWVRSLSLRAAMHGVYGRGSARAIT